MKGIDWNSRGLCGETISTIQELWGITSTMCGDELVLKRSLAVAVFLTVVQVIARDQVVAEQSTHIANVMELETRE